MASRLQTILTVLQQSESLDGAQRAACARRVEWLQEATDDEADQLLDALTEIASPTTENAVDPILTALLSNLARRYRIVAEKASTVGLTDATRRRIVLLYRHLGPDCLARHQLLGILASVGDSADLATFADLVIDDPPAGLTESAIPFTPLFRRTDYDPSCLFPRLLDGLAHLSVAASILDLANFVTRRQLVSQHPGTDRKDRLIMLLGGLVQQLEKLQEKPGTAGAPGASGTSIRRKVAESISLTVALCDALALIGDPSAVGKLYQAMELNHRHLRTEAAAALHRLGEESAADVLLAMAAEPAARLRALAYAEELGLLDKVAPEHRSSSARAEATFVAWLAEPTQFGLPPQQSEVVDSRTQYWPGFDQPVECHLIRYKYELPQGTYGNVGISGPLEHSFTADLTDLPPDEIYAAFAGWQVEHEAIREVTVEEFSDDQRALADQFQDRLTAEGFESIRPVKLGYFFEDTALVATAVRQSTVGVALIDQSQVYWRPAGKSRSPLGPYEAYCIYKGRKLLESFNQ